MRKAPPLFVSFENLENYLKALINQLDSKYQEDIKRLSQKKLPPIASVDYLSVLFGYSSQFLYAILSKPENYYRIFKIKKSKKGRREIQSPKIALKVIQKWFGYHLSQSQKSRNSDNAFGFIKGRTTFHGAKKHCGAKWVYCLDIASFFRSINEEMVKQLMIEIGYSKKGSKIIGNLCCYKGSLAEGSPVSPVLSNFIFKKTDDEIYKYVSKLGITYTRYADDLAFSSKQDISENDFKKIKIKIKKIIEKNGWALNKQKERFAKSPQRLKVYGLLIKEDKPILTKGYRNKIRAYKHILKKKEGSKIKDINKIKGHIAYANSIDKRNESQCKPQY